MNRTLVWFRRDLRLSDHAPLHRAARRGLVIPVFVFDRALLLHPETGAGRVRFMEARARRVERIDRQRHEVIHAPNVVPWITRLPEDVTPFGADLFPSDVSSIKHSARSNRTADSSICWYKRTVAQQKGRHRWKDSPRFWGWASLLDLPI